MCPARILSGIEGLFPNSNLILKYNNEDITIVSYFSQKQKLMKTIINQKLFFVLVFILCPLHILVGQGVVITEDVNDKVESHESAIFELRSAEKGILISRMTSLERAAITNPANGLLVFDIDENHFFYYDSSLIEGQGGWVKTLSGESILGVGETGKVAYWENDTTLSALPYMALKDNNFVQVTSREVAGDDDPIFEVRNREGHVVLGVYQTGVRIFVDDSHEKTSRGGFAVGGFTTGKDKQGVDYLRVTPDSVRVYVSNDATKTSRGGFAVGGFTTGKGYQELLRITSDSARIYVNDDPAKTSRGGFAVGGFTTGKALPANFLHLTPENYFIGHNSGHNITTGLFNSALGYESGANITEGSGNAFKGYQSGFNNTIGSGNLFLGYQSGFSNVDGDYNTFVGYLTGHSNTDGVLNSFMGSFSGFSNTTGSNNTFVGDSTGYHNLIGNNNTFLGTRTGLNNVDGHSNVFIGNQSGYSNDEGFDNIFIGNQAGFLHKSGEQNIYLGNNSGYSSVGTWGNVFIGFQSGKNTTTGSGNVFIGGNAGYSNITGFSNTFLGINAGYMFDGDYGNTFIGDHAGHKVTNSHLNLFLGPYAGYNFSESNAVSATNIFIGPGAGYNSNAGSSNIFIGFQSGYDNVESNGNVFLGYHSGRSITTGWGNVFLGGETGLKNTSGHGNVFLGAGTGKNNETGGYNTFLGAWTGESNITGTHNVFLGTSAGCNNNGNRNVFVGQFAGFSNTEGSGNVFIGPDAGHNEMGSNKLYIANSDYIPLIYGDFQARYVQFNSRVSMNGDPDMAYNLTIENFPAERAASIKLYGDGDGFNYANIALVSKGEGQNKLWQINHSKDENKYKLSYFDGVDSWRQMLMIDTDGVLTASGNIQPFTDNVYSIGTEENRWTTVYATNGTIQTSDARLKENIYKLNYGLNEILKLNPVLFSWKDNPSGYKKIGLIAQDVEKVIKEAVSIGNDDMQTYGINYSDLVPVLINGMQEQQQIIESQQAIIDNLILEIENIKSMIEK